MSEISWRYSNRRLLFEILISSLGPETDFRPVKAIALIDTGATRSGVCPSLIEKLGLRWIGRVRLETATEERMVGTHYCSLAIAHPGDDQSSQQPFFFGEFEVLRLKQSQTFEVIVGMDFLIQCDLIVERSGICTLRFG